MEEKDYRRLVDETFSKLGRAFENIDPDEAEFENSQGAVTILYKNGSRCILSTQPSVRQIWVAAASHGLAYHFNYEPSTGRWLDDKGKGVELFGCIRDLTSEAAGVEISLND